MKKIFFFFLIFNIAFSQTNSSIEESLLKNNPKSVFELNENSDYKQIDKFSADVPSSFKIIKNANDIPIIEAEILKTGGSHYDTQMSFASNFNIKKGDVLLAKFEIRSIYAKQESGEGVVYFFFQKNAGGKSIIVDVSASAEWKTIELPFIATENMKAGEASICFSFGNLLQKIEIANLKVLNFEKKVTLSQLPVTKFTYKGREENALWRKQALKRIEEIRTAPININIVDADGKPLSGLKVNAKMLQSDFIWGTSVNEELLANDMANSEKYKAVLKEFFNTAVIENGFKAATWTGKPKRKEETMKAFKWLEDNGFKQRGHNLVWPAWKFNTKTLKELALKDTIAFGKFIENEITEKVNLLKGRVIAWDVVNEIIHEREFFKYLPENSTVKWYKLAKKLDPNAQLFMNEYGMLNSIASPKFIKEYIDKINQMKNDGAPIDAIGIQGHVGRQPRNPEQVLNDLDMFIPTGLPVQITEFDINMTDEELQADYTRDFLIACYSHPVITGFTNWGFWKNKHWKPDAAMFNEDWTIKPNGLVWQELVTKLWKTNFTSITDKNGNMIDRGHLGLYEIIITDGKKTVKETYKLSKNGLPKTITF